MIILYLVLGVLVLSFIPVALVTIRALRKYRHPRMVSCPETHRSAAVQLDAGHAAFTAATGDTELRVERCPLWHGRKDCGQECVAQIETA